MESINDLKEQIQELATVMKSGSVNHKPNPPAVNGGQVKKFKKANQKQKKTVDAREGLVGPTANALCPFPPGQRPLQCHKCKGWGHVRRVCPSHLNFTRGRNAKQNLPPLEQESVEAQVLPAKKTQ